MCAQCQMHRTRLGSISGSTIRVACATQHFQPYASSNVCAREWEEGGGEGEVYLFFQVEPVHAHRFRAISLAVQGVLVSRAECFPFLAACVTGPRK